ncbi:unnamed protein product [Prorocentrum cordatum]|uniref:Uncharacterized protein n=1 Tax=Prorocentrum cordatum TaxID=2364126 RepID=A0ABN9UNQ5_9DINO|nr:unnamed protein product [Polarella glacialis]
MAAAAPPGARRPTCRGELPAGPDGPRQGGARSRQWAKRAVFPKINQAIIAAAEHDLPTTIAVVEPLIPQMNLVNISTALHRLARLSSSSPESLHQLRGHPVMPALLAAAAMALDRTRDTGAQPKTQVLSNVTWAMATMQTLDLHLLTKVVALSEEVTSLFKAFELSGLLWGLATLGGLEPEVLRLAEPIFARASGQVSGDFSFRCLVMTSWAYAAAGWRDAGLFQRLGDLMLPGLRSASGPELQSISWAFAAAGVHHGAVLSQVRWRLGGGGVGAADGGGATAPRATPREAARARRCPADRGGAPARARALHRPEAAEDTPACPEDAAATAQPGSCAEAAAAATEREPPAGGRVQQAAGTGWVCTVKNTFVDVSDGSTSSDESEDEAPLGPSLDCIPQGIIDPDELTAYRTSYQKFRSGKCRGAKGEVSHLGARA